MSKVTGKFQITLPKWLVDAYGIKIGDDVDFFPAGDRISLVPSLRARTVAANRRERVYNFDRFSMALHGLTPADQHIGSGDISVN